MTHHISSHVSLDLIPVYALVHLNEMIMKRETRFKEFLLSNFGDSFSNKLSKHLKLVKFEKNSFLKNQVLHDCLIFVVKGKLLLKYGHRNQTVGEIQAGEYLGE